MSERNIEVCRRGYDAMRRRDIDALLRWCHPEIEFISLVGEVEGRVYRGHDGLRQFFADLLGVWELWLVEPERFEAAGQAVLVTGNTRVRGRGSGLEMTIAWGQVFRFRGDKVVWAKIYADAGEARAEFESTPAG